MSAAMTPDEILNALNPEQRRAASMLNGPVLVLAGAGTGKTRVITYRIAYMLATGIPGESILGMTFTNKAASEMKERLAELCGTSAAGKVTLGTFHSFCGRVLRRDIGHLNFLPGFTIADESDQKGLIKQAAAELGIPKEDATVNDAAFFISRCKNALLEPAEAKLNATDAVLAAIYENYQKLLALQNMLDFDDMLLFTWKLFHEFPEVLQHYQERFQYLLVDEYQDTNLVQFEIIRLLAGERQNLCVVGDDDQSIYSWRGADSTNILKFTSIFPRAAAQEVKLEQNYRSTNNILRAANAAITGGYERKEKNLWSRHGDGELITVVSTDSAEAEADFIASYMGQLLEENRQFTYKDCAILYRSNYLSRQFEQTLRERGIPYQLVGGQEFYQRREVKDAAAYLRLIVNPRENQSLLRILGAPPRGLGEKAVEKLKELYREQRIPMSQALDSEEFQNAMSGKARVSALGLAQRLAFHREQFSQPGDLALKVRNFLLDVGYLEGLQRIYKDIKDAEKRRENVEEFISAIAQFENKCTTPPTLGDYLEKYSLLEESERTEDKSKDGDGVILTTIHASKGLEYPIVFLVAAEQGVFPNVRALEENSEAEELRLFYVAITRAKSILVISNAKARLRYGMMERNNPSRFLARLPQELLQVGEPEDFLTHMTLDEINDGFAKLFDLLK